MMIMSSNSGTVKLNARASANATNATSIAHARAITHAILKLSPLLSAMLIHASLHGYSKLRIGGESTMQGRGGDKSTPLVQGRVGIFITKYF